MSYLDLYAAPPLSFSGFKTIYADARYIVIGVPFDGTSTYRADSRFAPQAIREASLNIETYSFRSGLYVEDLRICDVGDLAVLVDIDETLGRIERATREVLAQKKVPVLIGGEHTLTLGAIRAFDTPIGVVSFDAHFDLRDEYMGARLSHATFMRRIVERVGHEWIVEVGVRAASREEIQYARQEGITYVTGNNLQAEGDEAMSVIRKAMEKWENVYISIDMDVLDPAQAPGVGNPEPEGLTATALLDALSEICDGRVRAIDVTEVAPHYDTGQTAIQASKVIFETLCYLESSISNRGHSSP